MALDAFGKIFETMYSGSMVGAGEHVFALWPYCIAHVRPPGVVEINPKLVAAIIGTTPENVQSALDFLCAPDPDSRSKVEDGRRLVREGQFLYRMVNFFEYRAKLSAEVKRENDRNRIADKRATSRNLSQPVVNVAQAEAEAEAEAEAYSPPSPACEKKRLHGIPKDDIEVIEYGKTLNPKVPESVCRDFFNHYEAQSRTGPNGDTFWVTSGENPTVITKWKNKLPCFRGSIPSKIQPLKPRFNGEKTCKDFLVITVNDHRGRFKITSPPKPNDYPKEGTYAIALDAYEDWQRKVKSGFYENA
jgi:hypothetical protein